MVRIGFIGTAADEAVDVGDLKTGVVDGVADRLDQEIGARYVGQFPDPAMAGADNGAGVAKFAGWFDHDRSSARVGIVDVAIIWRARGCARSRPAARRRRD